MLEHYFELNFKRERLRGCAGGEHMDDFAGSLMSAGYRRRPAQLLLRGAAHFCEWTAAQQTALDHADSGTVRAFAAHLAACECDHGFEGHDNYHQQGACRFVERLECRGILNKIKNAAAPAPPGLAFGEWMSKHRGARQSTIAQYLRIVGQFLAAVGTDPAFYDAASVRQFVLSKANATGRCAAQSAVNAVRMYLHFLAGQGLCSPDLIGATPRIAHWKLSSLPRYIAPDDVERVIATCDSSKLEGSRDKAILLLLSRLALRAGDVCALRLADIDWAHARIRVAGKGRCETLLPLPQDAGDAMLDYVEHHRPTVADGHVFLRIRPPFRHFPSSGPVSKLVRRAIQRAGLKTPSLGAHLLRHSSATAMVRQGASLDVVGAVLRHRSVESTAHYAKVNVELLRSVAQPWPGSGGCDAEASC